MESLKKKFLELLDKDVEFRYAVAGYLGLSEVLKRLDTLSEEQVRLRKEQVKLSKEQVKLREEQIKLSKEQVRLSGEQVKLSGELARLREDFNRMFESTNLRFDRVEMRLGRVERTLEKLTVDVEDEARSVVRDRLRVDFGLDVDVGSLVLPDVELNIYGVSDDLCIVGEATVRGGLKILDELLGKIEFLRRKYPERLRAKILPVIYVCLPLPELVEEARRRNIWLLKATRDYNKPSWLEM